MRACGQPRRALGIGHQLALAVAAPAPVVKRARNFVALDGALRQVAHVPAVPVQNLDVTVRVGEHHQLGAEGLDAVRFAVQVVLHRAQAVPAPRISVGQGAGVDLAIPLPAVSVVTSRLQPFTSN